MFCQNECTEDHGDDAIRQIRDFSFLSSKILTKSQWDHAPKRGAKYKWGTLKRQFSINISLYLRNGGWWRRGIAVTSLGVSTKLLYVGPGSYWDGWPSSTVKLPFTKPPRSTRPPTLSGTGNEYQPKCGDALRLGSKGRCGSFHLWINVWVAGKSLWSSLTRAIPERFRDESW